ncbi:MAG: DJ-1/PfpI family protein [Candidatus Limnocylindrales bacterium]
MSAALSMAGFVPGSIATRKVAILVAPKFDGAGVAALVKALAAEGAKGQLVGPVVGEIKSDDGQVHEAGFSILTTASVLFDAVYVAGGPGAADWSSETDAIEFVRDAFKHCKTVGASGEGIRLLEAAQIPVGEESGPAPADAATIVAAKGTRAVAQRFVKSMADGRLWSREPALHLPL